MTVAKVHCNNTERTYAVSTNKNAFHRYTESPSDGVFRVPWDESLIAHSLCGQAGWRQHSENSDYREGTTVPPRVFAKLPPAAQCQTCFKRRRQIAKKWFASFVEMRPHLHATEIEITAVEYFLVTVSRLYEPTSEAAA